MSISNQIGRWLQGRYVHETELAERHKYNYVRDDEVLAAKWLWRIFWNLLFEVKLGFNGYYVNAFSVLFATATGSIWLIPDSSTLSSHLYLQGALVIMQLWGVIYFCMGYYWNFAEYLRNKSEGPVMLDITFIRFLFVMTSIFGWFFLIVNTTMRLIRFVWNNTLGKKILIKE